MSKLISIIVPVYNVEKYLGKCLESLLNQTYKNLEIILIDDGSTDNSGKLCDIYQKQDNRVVVIHKENGGISSARNAGIEIAKGDYIALVDSDDYVSCEYCEKMLNALITNNAEVAICKLHSFRENEKVILENKEYEEEITTPEETIRKSIIIESHYNCAGGKMVARDLMKKHPFPLNRYYEDAATVYKLYSDAKKTVTINQEYYFYLRNREGSIVSSKYNLKYQNDDYLWVTEKCEYLLKKFPKMKEFIKATYIKYMIAIIHQSYRTKDEKLIQSNIIKQFEVELRKQVQEIDKNVLREVLNDYRHACLYLFLHDKEIFMDNVEKLYLTRHNGE